MGLADIQYLNAVDQTAALDTVKASLGAPGKPGEVRMHWDVTYGWQIYRLMLNESGSSIATALGVVCTAGTAHAGQSISALSATTSVIQKFGGVTVATLADDYWGWLLVGGDGLLKLLTLSAQNAVIETAANGTFDDTSGTGLKVGVQLGATVGTATTATRCHLNGIL